MNFELLKNFQAVIAAGSFSKAAAKLFISQQGLNKSITALEHELGSKLINRTQHGVELTENGKTFLHHAERILVEYFEMLKNLSIFKRDIEFITSTDIKVVASPTCTHNILIPMMEKFSLHNITLQEVVTKDVFTLMDRPNCLFLADLFLPFYPQKEFGEQYEAIPLINTTWGVIARKSIVPELSRSVSRESVSKLPLGLFYNETTQAMYTSIFQDMPLENVQLATVDRGTLFESMLSGRLAILIDSFQWQQIPSSYKDGPNKLVFAEIEGNNCISFSFIYKKSNPPDEKSQSYLTSFVQVFKEIIANPRIEN